MVRCEVLDLFLHNPEVEIDEFLVCEGNDKKIDKLITIDKNQGFCKEFHSRFVDLKKGGQGAYQNLWELFKMDKIHINFQVGLDLAKQISSLSDENWAELLSGLPYRDMNTDMNYYLSQLLKEKKNFDKKYIRYIETLHGLSFKKKIK